MFKQKARQFLLFILRCFKNQPVNEDKKFNYSKIKAQKISILVEIPRAFKLRLNYSSFINSLKNTINTASINPKTAAIAILSIRLLDNGCEGVIASA